MSTEIGPDTPAAAPPAGTVSNFYILEDNVPGPIIVNAIFIFLMAVAVSVRMYVKSSITRAVGLDDCEYTDTTWAIPWLICIQILVSSLR